MCDTTEAQSMARELNAAELEAYTDRVLHAVDDNRPFVAAQLLAEHVLPEAEKQRSDLRALTFHSAGATSIQGNAVATLQDRIHAFTAFRSALMRGQVDDEVVLHALRTLRVSEAALNETRARLRDECHVELEAR